MLTTIHIPTHNMSFVLEQEKNVFCFFVNFKLVLEPIFFTKSCKLQVYFGLATKPAIMNSLWISFSGRSKIVLEDISETLYTRPSLLSDLSVNELNKRFVNVTRPDTKCSNHHEKTKNKRRKSITKSSLTVNFTVIEMLRGKIRPQNLSRDVSRWSDCDCGLCTSWASTTDKNHSLFVKTQIPNGT